MTEQSRERDEPVDTVIELRRWLRHAGVLLGTPAAFAAERLHMLRCARTWTAAALAAIEQLIDEEAKKHANDDTLDCR